MRLALINPNTSTDTTTLMMEIAARAAGSNIDIEGYTAPFGAALITAPEALARAAQAVEALAPALVGVDAVIVAAFGDPGVLALRNALSVPVTGIAEAGMQDAARGGRRFAVVTTTPDLTAQIAETARINGHARFAGTWTTRGDPAALTADSDALVPALAAAIEAAVREGHAESVVIGGGPLAMAARALAATSPVPLIEPVPAAVRLSLKRLSRELQT